MYLEGTGAYDKQLIHLSLIVLRHQSVLFNAARMNSKHKRVSLLHSV